MNKKSRVISLYVACVWCVCCALLSTVFLFMAKKSYRNIEEFDFHGAPHVTAVFTRDSETDEPVDAKVSILEYQPYPTCVVSQYNTVSMGHKLIIWHPLKPYEARIYAPGYCVSKIKVGQDFCESFDIELRKCRGETCPNDECRMFREITTGNNELERLQ